MASIEDFKRDIRIKVKASKGNCMMGYKEADEWVIDSHTVPEGFCAHAFYVLYPWIQTLRMGGKIPWGDDPDIITIPCIDEKDQVIFEIKRV